MDAAVAEGRTAGSVFTNSGRRRRPCRSEAKSAVRRLIDREGLAGIPARAVRALEEFFAGYNEDPVALLATTFEDTAAYNEMIALRAIRLESHCEHHIVPIPGKAHIGCLTAGRVVGISKLARLVKVLAKRTQIHEVPTSQIADTIQEVLKPHGVGVVIEAAYQCVTTRAGSAGRVSAW